MSWLCKIFRVESTRSLQIVLDGLSSACFLEGRGRRLHQLDPLQDRRARQPIRLRWQVPTDATSFLDDGRDETLLMHRGTELEAVSTMGVNLTDPEYTMNPMSKFVQMVKDFFSLRVTTRTRGKALQGCH